MYFASVVVYRMEVRRCLERVLVLLPPAEVAEKNVASSVTAAVSGLRKSLLEGGVGFQWEQRRESETCLKFRCRQQSGLIIKPSRKLTL